MGPGTVSASRDRNSPPGAAETDHHAPASLSAASGATEGGLPPGIEAATGLPDARLRLAYINHHRELALGALLGLAAAARLLGAPVGIGVLVILAFWFAASRTLVEVAGRTPEGGHLQRVEFSYFVLELGLITLLARYAGAAAWLALLFYVVTVLFANMVLPRRAALGVDALAALAFSALVALQNWKPLPGGSFRLAPSANFHHPGSLVVLTLGALGGYALIGVTLAQFSLMINRQAAALHAANRDLNAASRELRLHKDHLEELVRQRTADLLRASDELRRANHELRRMNQLKNNFLANVSHELRTPLTSIRSFSEILLSYPDEDLATRSEFLRIIVHESDRLTRLINDVLDLAKIEAGKMEWRPRPVVLSEMVRRTMDLFQVMAAQQGVTLINSIPNGLPPAQADPDRLAQVLTNLLSNALKFTRQGSIRVGALAPSAGNVLASPSEITLFVADTGCGIEASELERIFEKFHQCGEGLTDKPAGSGLGLAICREILRYHGGRIWAESRPGEGSVFYCALPVASLAAMEVPA